MFLTNMIPARRPPPARSLASACESLCTIREYARPPLLPVERCHAVLQEAFEVASSPDKKVAELGSSGVLLVVRMLLGSAAGTNAAKPGGKRKGKAPAVPAGAHDGWGALDLGLVTDLYSGLFADFMGKKKRQPAQPLVFISLCKRHPDLGWHLLPHFAKGITDGANDYLRSQAMLILKELLQRHSAASALSAQGVHSGLGLVESGLAAQLAATAAEPAAAKVKYVRSTLAFAMMLVKALKALRVPAAGAELGKSLGALLASPLAAKSAPVKTVATQVLRMLEQLVAGSSGRGADGQGRAGGEAASAAGRKRSKPASVPEPSAKKSKKKKKKRA